MNALWRTALVMVLAAVAVVGGGVLGGSANAFRWPWQDDGDELVRGLAGYVSCGQVVGTNGFGAAPASLRLSGAGIDQTLTWPREVRGGGGVFGRPTTTRRAFPPGPRARVWGREQPRLCSSCSPQSGVPATAPSGAGRIPVPPPSAIGHATAVLLVPLVNGWSLPERSR